MVERCLQIDLSAQARDFVGASFNDAPLLDKSNSSDRRARRVLGRLALQPVRRGDSVEFFVCDDMGGQPHDVICEPVTDRELRGNQELKKDLEELQQRLQKVEPAEFRQALVKNFEYARQSGAAHQGCFLIKWKTKGGAWRLAWAWGFQRKDMEPAPAQVCPNPKCRHLFVKRSDDPDCPGCRQRPDKAGGGGGDGGPWKKVAAVLGGLALVAVLVVAWLLLKPTPPPRPQPVVPPAEPQFVAVPAEWTGPVGGRVEFAVRRKSADGQEEDVTRQVVARSDNPRVVRMDRAGTAAHARSPGKSVVTFHLGSETAQATLTVEPPRNPAKIVIEPSQLTLAVGATGRLRLVGQYDGGATVDLSETAQWLSTDGGAVFVHRGLLEGLRKGTATVRSLYRATPDQPLLDAAAQIEVKDEAYREFRLSLDRSDLAPGQTTGLKAVAVTKSDQHYPVLGSSHLKLDVQPEHLARMEQGVLRAVRPGAGKLMGTFQGLTGSTDFQVSADASPAPFDVLPKALELAVGEVAELEIITASTAPVELVSSLPQVVAVRDDCRVVRRLVGRSEGKATVVVAQEGRRAEVQVEVTRAAFQSIAVVPDQLTVAVDETVPLRVVGRAADGGEVELAPERVQAERLPAPAFLDFDPSRLTVRGVSATAGMPQVLTLRAGDLKASATITVVAAPLRLTLTPAGPVAVPVGQATPLQAWATYGDGRRVEVAPSRVRWEVSPAQVEGLAFERQTGTVRAGKEGGGPLTVKAGYQGSESQPVVVEAVKAAPRTLQLAADRNPIVVGETGQLRVTFREPDAQGATRAEGAEFVSKPAEVLQVNRRTGAYTALAAGEVVVGVRHPAAATAATQTLRVVERKDGELVFRPATLELPVGGRAALSLLLVTAGGQRPIPLAGDPAVRLACAEREAVRWEPPALVGLRPSEPFEFAATWQGKTAVATVRVLAEDKQHPPELRCVPADVTLAPGQPCSPRIEQRPSGSAGGWTEVEPRRVQWDGAPAGVTWTPAADQLPPRVVLEAAAPEQVKLEATYLGAKAEFTIHRQAADQVPKASEPNVELVVVREPGGETLAVPEQQRYTILIDKGGTRQPAANVDWQPAFESEYAQWQPPVLTARRPGHVQRLKAAVDGREVAWETRLVASPAPPAPEVPPTDEKPKLVRITAAQGNAVSIPVGAEFSDFRVEAESERGTVRDVTRSARLLVEGKPEEAAVSVSAGRLKGVRAGKAQVQAEYQGVRSTEGLAVEVGAAAALTAIEIRPPDLKLVVDETVGVQAIGFSGEGDKRVSVGDITNRGDVVWESKTPELLRVAGPSLTALQAGRATVVVKQGAVTATAEVTIAAAIGAQTGTLEVSPESLQVRVGEAKSLGDDIRVQRGGADFTRDAEIVSSRPSVVRVDRERNSVIGVSPGEAELAVAYGGQRAVMPVTVTPAAEPAGAVQVVIEPATGTLAVGQSQEVRVFAVGPAGQKLDRTGSAVLESANPQVLSVQGTQVIGQSAGEAKVTAQLPDSDQRGEAQFTVQDEKFTDLEVSPPELKLGTGEEKQLRIQGVAASGRRELSEHPALKIQASGAAPQAVAVQGTTVRGQAAGKATVDIRWGDSLSKSVPVEVTDEPWRGLRIEPVEATVAVGEQEAFLVYAKRGANERALTAEDGLQVRLSNTSVARLQDALTAVGAQPGFTNVTVRLGALSAAAKLTVTAADQPEPPATPPVLPPGLRFIPDVLSLQLGTPGASVRVVKVGADGREEDADHRTQMKFTGAKDVAKMEWTASGPVFKPSNLGTTRVLATYDGVPTRRPLVITVRDLSANARLEVRPDPVTLQIGQTAEFQRVQIGPGRGGAAVDVNYRVEPADAAIVAVENGRTLRGVAQGETQVKVTPVGADPRFKDLSATIPVQVNAAPGDEQQAPELLLAGPSQTTVGATAQFTVELATAGGAKDVTSDGATLVLDRDQASFADIAPGGAVVGKKEGVVNLKARYKDLISAPVSLRIDPVAAKFEKLEVEIERKPLTVGESRPYRVWGYPQGGGPKQDLTNSVTAAGSEPGKPRVLVRADPKATGEVIAHEPPNVIGKAPGDFVLGAALDELRSDVLNLKVVEGGAEDAMLSAEPRSISVRVGQPAPSVRVLARRPGDPSPWPVDAKFECQDPKILAPAEDGAGQFVGRDVGRTQLVATFGQQRAAIEVAVLSNPFQKVEVRREKRSVKISIEGRMSSDTEYRLLVTNEPPGDGWQPAQRDGQRVTIELASPLPAVGLEDEDTVYHWIVEARSKDSTATERYPCTFRLRVTIEDKSEPAARN